MNHPGEERIIGLVSEWLTNHTEGTLIFSTSFLLELWEEKICSAFPSMGGIRMGLFSGIIEEITQIRNEQRGIQSEDQYFLLWAAAHGLISRQTPEDGANPWSHPGLVKNISVMIKELKQAGITKAELLTKACFPEEFTGIYKGYEEILSSLELFDYESAFDEACRLLTIRGVPAHLRHVAIIGFREFTVQQNVFLKILRSQGDLEIIDLIPEQEIKSSLSIPLNKEIILRRPLLIEGFTAADREWEIREIARLILRRHSQGIPFSELAVVFRDLRYYQAFLKRILIEYRIPWNEPASVSWLKLPVLSSLLLWLRLADQDSQPTRAEMTFLFNQYFTGTFGLTVDGWLAEDISISRKNISLKDWAVWLREHAEENEPSLTVKIVGLARHCESPKTKMTLLEFMTLTREWIVGWEEGPDIPSATGNEGSDWEIRRVLTEKAHESLIETWDRWMTWTSRLAIEEWIMTGESFATLLENLLAEKITSAQLGPVDCVTIATPAQIQYNRFDSIFLGGLVEGEYPKRQSRSFLMSQESYQSLRGQGYPIKSAEEFIRAERQSFLYLLAGARSALYLSSPSADVDGRTLAPSPYFIEMKNLLEEKESPWTHIHPADGFVSDACSPESNGWFQYSELSRPLTAETKACIASEKKRFRRDPEFTGFIGVDPTVAMGLEREFSSNYSFSPSALKEFAVCPFGFFCHRVLRIQPPDEPAPLPNPAELGSLYHEILRTFFERHKGERLLDSESDIYVGEIQAIADEKASGWSNSPDSTGDAYILHRLQLSTVKENLRLFIREELNWQTKTGWHFLPSEFEKSFGSPDDPFILLSDEQGEPIKLTGKIDRVDRSADGQSFIIFDYKTGGVPSAKEIAEGLDLQLPIYLKAAERLMQPSRSLGAGYCSLKKHERTAGLWKKSWVETSGVTIRNAKTDAEWEEALQSAEGFIARHVSAIRHGDFHPVDGDCSDYCPYKAVCRRDKAGGELEDAAE